ncbi:unnamed protein product [Pylaiella littoralis]
MRYQHFSPLKAGVGLLSLPHSFLSFGFLLKAGSSALITRELTARRGTFVTAAAAAAAAAVTMSSTSDASEVRASAHWEGHWSGGLNKGDLWDTGVVSPALQKLLDEGVLPKGRSLVPGCGRGYDAIAFGKSGYDSTGLDLSPTGVEQAKALLAEQKGEEMNGQVDFRSGDFFKFSPEQEGKFDVILDYTFLCALDPSARNDWADHMVALLRPEGELVTLIFPIVEKDGGPPFAVSETMVSGLLEPRGLKAVHLEKLPPSLCHKGREGKTALGRWRFSSSAKTFTESS